MWRQDASRAGPARGEVPRSGLEWAPAVIVLVHLSVSHVAAGLGASWHTANSAIIAEGGRRLIDDEARFDGVNAIGVDDHVWRHIRLSDQYVTVIIDLTPAREQTDPPQLLDVIENLAKAAYKQWPAGRPKPWWDWIEVVAKDGFSGFKTAAAKELPDSIPAMDPFHVV